jgi:hypothetical protein
VAEGLDQTRGWFYTLMVLSTALFDKPAFKNLVCNGLVLAADGKKMSKRLKNYPVRAAPAACRPPPAAPAWSGLAWPGLQGLLRSADAAVQRRYAGAGGAGALPPALGLGGPLKSGATPG